MMQLAIIFGICLLSEGITKILPFAFPSSVIAMILVFLVLFSGILKIYHIKKQTDFLLENMAFFFIPAAVSIADNLFYMQGKLLIIIFICIVSTITTFFITALAVKGTVILEKHLKELKNHD